MEIIEIVKKHPLPIGAGVLLILFLLMRSSSPASQAGAMANAQLQQQSIASNTDISLSGINAKLASERSGYAADIWKTTIGANAAVAMSQGKDTVSSLIAVLSHSDNVRKIDAQLEATNNQTAAQQSIAARSLDTAITLNRDSNNSKLTALAETLKLDKYKTDVTAANLPALLQGEENRLAIYANSAATLATINGQTAQAIAALNTSASRTTAEASKDKGESDSWLKWAGYAAALFL